MWILLIPLLAQAPADRPLLEAEQAREAGVSTLLTAIQGKDTHAQGLAARAIGRLENPTYRDAIVPLLRSPDPQVRRSAAAALAQMRVAPPPASAADSDPSVRAVIYEAIGRAKPPSGNAESQLAAGLSDSDATARTGAARGLESLFRLNRMLKPSAATTTAMHQAFAANRNEELRELTLLTMNAAKDRDQATVTAALADPSPQVRRLAVLATGNWKDDESPIVRYESLRLAKSCDRASASLKDASDHVALEAIDLLGTLHCNANLITPLTSAKSWRIRAHAIVSLARVDPAQAREKLAAMMADPIWQVRAYTARAARLANASGVLATLARHRNPNVAIAALTTPDYPHSTPQ
jgi:HEAT repeat protein